MFKFNPSFIFPTIVLILFITFIYPINQSSAQDTIIPGEVQHHPADDEIIWDWLSYVPENLSKNDTGQILVSAGGGNSDLDAQLEITSSYLAYTTQFSDPYKLIRLGVPMLRRDLDVVDAPYVYLPAFTVNTFNEPEDFYRRPDLKVNQIIDKFIILLRDQGYKVEDKVFF